MHICQGCLIYFSAGRREHKEVSPQINVRVKTVTVCMKFVWMDNIFDVKARGEECEVVKIVLAIRKSIYV
uniref:Uncharacterized protein n=1 Tax=Virgibacillus oceani TaxID=1479511 RepID=A0A917MA69_9BACI|nr:hypothetical protein GCM10011398_36880 [Virgibacillus oceani]